MDDDILNCPFCGGPVEIAGVGRVYIRCRICRARGKTYRFRWFNEDSYIEAEVRAVRAWNRRLGRYDKKS